MPFSDVLRAFILFVRYELSIKFTALIIWSGIASIAVSQRASFEKEACKNCKECFTKKQHSIDKMFMATSLFY